VALSLFGWFHVQTLEDYSSSREKCDEIAVAFRNPNVKLDCDYLAEMFDVFFQRVALSSLELGKRIKAGSSPKCGDLWYFVSS
jgi:hypothetical protein